MTDRKDGATTPTPPDDDKSQGDYQQLSQRWEASQEHIGTLEAENRELRENAGKLAERLARLEGIEDTRQQSAASQKQEPTRLESLMARLNDPKEREKLDASPADAFAGLVEAIQEQGAVQTHRVKELGDIMVEAFKSQGKDATLEAVKTLLSKEIETLPAQLQARSELEAYAEPIAELRKDEALKGLSEQQLLVIAKKMSGDEEIEGYAGSAGGGKVPSGRVVPKVTKAEYERYYRAGLQFHGGNAEKAKAYADKVVQKLQMGG